METTTAPPGQPHFRATIMLNALLTAINNKGKPLLPDESRLHKTLDEGNSTARKLLLDSVVNILIRHGEVLSAAAHLTPNSTSNHRNQCNTLSAAEVLDWSGGEEVIFTTDDRCSGFTLTSNPRDSDNCFGPNERVACKLLKPGKSHLSLCTDWDSLLTISRNDPLPNHVATLEDYLAKYRTTDLERRTTLFYNFSKYILITSWRKLLHRMDTSHSKFFIDDLSKVGEQDILAAFTEHSASLPEASRSDYAIAGLLLGMEKEEMQRLVPAGLPNLLAAFARLGEAKSGQAPMGLGAYSATTCYEFHQLLIASLIAYRDALRAFGMELTGLNVLANTKDRDEDELRKCQCRVKQCAEWLWKCYYLLWRISFSQMLPHHLALLSKGQCLSFPGSDNIPADQESLRDRHGSSGVDASGQRNWAEGEDGREDDYVHVLKQKFAADDNTGNMLYRWCRRQVVHFAAHAILTRYCTEADPKDTLISIIAARDATTEMVDWENLIHSLSAEAAKVPDTTHSSRACHLEPFDAPFAIREIKRRVQEFSGMTCDSILKEFGRNIDQALNLHPLFYGRLHCEAILASLIAYVKSGGTGFALDADLIAVLKNLDPSVIGVSKLSCPVCWELLRILRSMHKSMAFSVGGRHPVLSPVQIPGWLSPDVVVDMVDRFQYPLDQEIIAMIQARRTPAPLVVGHYRSTSQQSQSGLSTVSGTSSEDYVDGWPLKD